MLNGFEMALCCIVLWMLALVGMVDTPGIGACRFMMEDKCGYD